MISVIMSTYNEENMLIRQAVESILNQTYSEFEFIIVLDNPKNIEIANLIQEYASRDKRIVILKNEKNLGLVKSLNKALEISKGEYIMRMDADDISEKDRIEKEYKFLKENNLDLVARESYKNR